MTRALVFSPRQTACVASYNVAASTSTASIVGGCDKSSGALTIKAAAIS